MSQPKLDRITHDPNVLDGLPTVRDTGITVSEVVKALMGGKTEDEVLAEHPQLESEDVTQALICSVHELTNLIRLPMYELRTPIAIIETCTDLLAKHGHHITDDQKQKHGDKIREETRYIAEQYMLHIRWSQLYADYQPVMEETLGPQFLDRVSQAIEYLKPTINIELLAPEHLPPLAVSHELQEVVKSLATTQLQAHLQTGAKITVTWDEVPPPKIQIERKVFSQSDQDYESVLASRNQAASPIALAAYIIRQHGSELKIHPTEDGVTFEFELPIWSESHE